MKRRGGLFPEIIKSETILRAHMSARTGKSHYNDVKAVNAREPEMLAAIQKSLADKTFTTSEYTACNMFDGRKMRLIHKLPYYPDRIVQHALVGVCEDVWMKSYIRDTYQSIPGRGTADARKRVWKAIKGSEGRYALKFDIQKYYPSVDHEILRSEVRRYIKCPDTLWLIDDIIRSGPGIPIGNYTSQHFGNLYLNRFDWWVKQQLGVKHYFRYCDDIVLIGDSAAQCHAWREQCFAKLRSEFKLEIKNNWQVSSLDVQGLDFVGYVFYPDKIRVRRSMANKFRRKIRHIRRHRKSMAKPQFVGATMAYWGWFKHANAKALWKSQICYGISNKMAALGLKKNPLERIMK